MHTIDDHYESKFIDKYLFSRKEKNKINKIVPLETRKGNEL